MTDRLRAVLDTNVFLSAFLSHNPTSPTKEILQRWQAGEFVFLVSNIVVASRTGLKARDSSAQGIALGKVLAS